MREDVKTVHDPVTSDLIGALISVRLIMKLLLFNSKIDFNFSLIRNGCQWEC